MFRVLFDQNARGRYRGGCLVASLACLGLTVAAVAQETKKEVDWSLLLPDGDGKNSVLTACATCHGLDRIVLRQRDKDEWYATIGLMTGEYYAQVSEEEIEKIAAYLSRAAGPDNPLTEIPMDLNAMPPAALKRLRFLSEQQIAQIVAQRAPKNFESLEEAEKLLRLSSEKAELFRVYVAVKKAARGTQPPDSR